MRTEKLFFLLPLLILVSCSSQNDVDLAKQYRSELQSYENAAKFVRLNMQEEAIESCLQTQMLRSECFVSYVQDALAKEISPKREYCDYIQTRGMNMTLRAFGIAYGNVSDEMEMEFIRKIKPDPERIARVIAIKENCIQASTP